MSADPVSAAADPVALDLVLDALGEVLGTGSLSASESESVSGAATAAGARPEAPEPGAIGPATRLLELPEFDSLALASLVELLEARLGRPLPDEAIVPAAFETPTSIAVALVAPAISPSDGRSTAVTVTTHRRITATPRLLSDLVDAAADRFGTRTAIVSGDRSISFTELATATRVVDAELRRLGVARGEPVVVIIDDFLTAIPWMLGVARRGAVYVLMNADTTRYAAEHIIADSGARLALSSGQSESRRCAEALGLAVADVPVAGVAAPAGPDPSPLDVPVSFDLVSILYTSGSTGRPKGVVGTHANMVFAAEAIAARLRLREDDVIGCVLPLAFDYGVYQILLILLSGARLVWGAGTAAGPGLLSFLVDNGVTVLPVVPGLAQNLDRLTRRAGGSGAALPPLRVLTNTGAAMSVDLRLRIQRAYPDLGVYLMFGLTECKRVSMLLPEELATKGASVGRPLDDTECVIIDAEGRALPPGEVGELVVRGPHVTAGYWNDPERTALRFRPWGPMGERALFTGDQCRLDADGYLYFEGRNDDVYKANGFRVSATEVAMAAEEIPGVDEAFCVPGRGDESALLAVVADVDAHRVREELQKLLEWFKVPDDIVVVDQLPLNRNGKVDTVAVQALRPVRAGGSGRAPAPVVGAAPPDQRPPEQPAPEVREIQPVLEAHQAGS